MTSSLVTTLTIISFTFLSSLASVGFIRKYLQGQLLDVPNERSSHTIPTPRGGGLGFIIAVALAIPLCRAMAPDDLAGISPIIWFMLIPLVSIGLLDDWLSLSSKVRYLVQFSVASIIVYSVRPFPIPGVDTLGVTGTWLAVGLTIIGMTALINFYNFMDGLDGLVAGVALVQFSFLAVWFHQPVLWFWVAALLGFLCWNWSPAKIFMGDAGSTTLGAIIGLSFLSSPQTDLGQAWTTLALLLPLVGDAIYTIGRRFLKGENIFQAHRTHLYQRLHQMGWSHAKVAGSYIILTVLLGLGITYLGSIAAWVGLGVMPCAIALTEFYLARSTQLATDI